MKRRARCASACSGTLTTNGEAIKVVSTLLEYLPNIHRYQVILMTRQMEEILASQRRMLVRHKEPTDGLSDAEMAHLFRNHIQRTRKWLLYPKPMPLCWK
jgi:hypothetical protein